jgi:hypothetical protein
MLVSSLDDLVHNFIRRFADPKVAEPRAWMPYQHRIACAVVQSTLNRECGIYTVLISRQAGKTEAFSAGAAAAFLWLLLLMLSEREIIPGLPFGHALAQAFPDGLRIGIFSPKDESGARDYERIQTMVKRVAKTLGLSVVVANTVRTVIRGLGPDNQDRQFFNMELHSAAPGANVESGTFDIIVCEEAQDLDSHMVLAKIDPSRAATQGSRWMIGTVGDAVCLFDREIDDNRAYHPDRHVEADWQEVVRCGYQRGAYANFVHSIISEKGENSPFFRQKFCLERNYATGMLLTETGFLKLAITSEPPLSNPGQAAPPLSSPRWEKQPYSLPNNVFLVAGLDVARIHDFTVLKIGTADWRHIRFGDEFCHQWPDKIIRWQKTYPHADYDSQLYDILHDLERFPELKKNGAIAVDATGDRGNFAPRLITAGYYVLPIVFKGGLKETEVDEKTGEINIGSKSHLCQQLEDAIQTKHFFFAADEHYMGTRDFQRLSRPAEWIKGEAPILEPSPEYKAHKHEATHCLRIVKGNSLNFIADPKDETAHDDQIDADMLFTLAANFFQPVNYNLLTATGSTRVTAGLQTSIRSDLHISRNP